MAKKAKKFEPAWGENHQSAKMRLNFVHLDKPVQYDNKGAYRYSVNAIGNRVPGGKLDQIIADCDKVRMASFGDDPNVLMPYEEGNSIIKRIDEPGETTIALYKDRWRIAAYAGAEGKDGKKFEPPKLYFADGNLIPRRPGNDEDLRQIATIFYDGVFGAVAVSPYSYQMSATNKGVSLLLRGVRFVCDGRRLGAADVDAIMAGEIVEEGDWNEEVDAEEEEEDSGDPAHDGLPE